MRGIITLPPVSLPTINNVACISPLVCCLPVIVNDVPDTVTLLAADASPTNLGTVVPPVPPEATISHALESDNIAVYRYPTEQETTGESITARIPVQLKTFSNTTFETYSVAGSSFIRTYIKVTGLNSGLSKTFEVQIS